VGISLGRALLGVLGGALILAILIGAFVLFEIIDRWTDTPGMRSHVNDASDRYFADCGTIWRGAARKAAAIARRFIWRRNVLP